MSLCLRAFFALALLVLAGCQTPAYREISDEELMNRYEDFIGGYAADIDASTDVSERRIAREYRELASGKPQSYDLLILSGGGAFGAFGAGFLEGWGTIENPEFARPHFDAVSGISTGAMIAPYAFVGTSEAYETIVGFYENPGDRWVKRRGFIPYLPGNVSLFDVSDLHEQIRSAVTPELIGELDELARGAKMQTDFVVNACREF